MYISIHGGLDQEKLGFLKAAEMKVIIHQNEFCRMNLDEQSFGVGCMATSPTCPVEQGNQSYDPCIDPRKLLQIIKS